MERQETNRNRRLIYDAFADTGIDGLIRDANTFSDNRETAIGRYIAVVDRLMQKSILTLDEKDFFRVCLSKIDLYLHDAGYGHNEGYSEEEKLRINEVGRVVNMIINNRFSK